MSSVQGMFFTLSDPNSTLVNYAVDPVIREYDRMVYLALSEYFFDSGMYSYYKAEVFQMHIFNEKVKPQTHQTTTNPRMFHTSTSSPPPNSPLRFTPKNQSDPV